MLLPINCCLFPYKANMPESARWETRCFSTMVPWFGGLKFAVLWIQSFQWSWERRCPQMVGHLFMGSGM